MDGGMMNADLAGWPENEREADERLNLIRKIAAGGEPLVIRMTNDFAMKRVLHNKKALTGFLSSALELMPDEIRRLEFPDTVLRGRIRGRPRRDFGCAGYLEQQPENQCGAAG